MKGGTLSTAYKDQLPAPGIQIAEIHEDEQITVHISKVKHEANATYCAESCYWQPSCRFVNSWLQMTWSINSYSASHDN